MSKVSCFVVSFCTECNESGMANKVLFPFAECIVMDVMKEKEKAWKRGFDATTNLEKEEEHEC